MDTTRMEDVRVEEVMPLTDSDQARAGMGNATAHSASSSSCRMPVMASFTPTLTSTLPFALRVRLDDGRRAVADPQDPRHRRRAARRAGAGHGAGIRRRQRDRPRPFRDVANAEGRRRPVERSRDRARCPRGTYVVRAGQPHGLAGVLSARAGERGRAGAVELPRRTSSPRTPTFRSFASRSRRRFKSHTPSATDAPFHAAVSLQSAADLPLRSQQPARQDDSPRASSPARRSTKRSPPCARSTPRASRRRSTCSARA